MIFAVAVILYLSYVCSKKLGGGVLPGAGTSKNIRIIEKAFLGREKSVVIIRVGRKDYLLGVSQEGVRLLKELEEGQITLEEQEEQKNDPLDWGGKRSVGSVIACRML